MDEEDALVTVSFKKKEERVGVAHAEFKLMRNYTAEALQHTGGRVSRMSSWGICAGKD